MARKRRLRSLLVGLLVVVFTLSAVGSMVAVWARSTVYDSDRWAELTGQIIQDPDVQEGVSLRLSTFLVEALDVEQRVEAALSQQDRLPELASLLAGPVADGVRGRFQNRIETTLRNPEVQRLWVSANRRAHEAIIRVLREETRPGVTATSGVVTLDLLPLVNRALAATQDLLNDLLDRPIDVPTAEEIQAAGTTDQVRALLEERLGVDLPDNAGQLVLFRSDRLAAAQDAVRLLDTFVVVLLVLTLLLFVAALALSTRRRRTLIQLGIGMLIGALIARLIVRAIENNIVDLARVQFRGAVLDAVTVVFERLLDLSALLLIAGIVLGVAAYLAGRPAWLQRLRAKLRTPSDGAGESRTTAWIRTHSDALQLAGVAVAVIALFIVDLSWASVLVTGILLIAFEIWVARLGRASA